MSNIRNILQDIHNFLLSKFNLTGTEMNEPEMAHFNQPGWSNRCWTSDLYRFAQINTVQTSSLYMMHCCIFPHFYNTSPIFGFDVFAGNNKITGFFHDFSPTVPQNPMSTWFQNQTKSLTWKQVRILPDWALLIFSTDIIAASNIQDIEELVQIKNTTKLTTEYYLANINKYNDITNNTVDKQVFYCRQQKQNPNNFRVLVSLGLTEEQANKYIETCLFLEP